MANEKRLADVNALLEEIDRTIEIMEKRRDRISVRNVIMCIKMPPPWMPWKWYTGGG